MNIKTKGTNRDRRVMSPTLYSLVEPIIYVIYDNQGD